MVWGLLLEWDGNGESYLVLKGGLKSQDQESPRKAGGKMNRSEIRCLNVVHLETLAVVRT